MPDIKAVLLDLDGTLIDAFAPIIRAMQQTLREFGLPELSELEIRQHTGKGDCSMTALFGDAKEQASQRFLQLHDADYISGIRPLDGAEALLKDLHDKQVPVAIVTSKGQQRAEEQLQHFDWLPWIDVIIGKVDGRASKPDPAPLLLACDALGVAPQHSIMVGDGTADMKAAVRAAAYPIGVTHTFPAETLQAAGAVQIFHTIPEVHTWLNTQIP